jgi:hypothetical protein
MTTVRGPHDRVEEVARLAGEAMLTWLREFEGYRGLLLLADETAGVARVVTFWESAEAEVRSRPGRLGIRDKLTATAGFETVSTEPYAVPMVELDTRE